MARLRQAAAVAPAAPTVTLYVRVRDDVDQQALTISQEAAMAYPIGSSEWHESAAHVCYSGYCSSETLECTIKSLANFVGGCSLDGDAQCPDDTTCVDGTCVPTVGPSQRAARQRRDVLCPAPFVSCTILESSTGFECIDTQSNIEQCGACAKDGGVDCSALPGVESVGCVAGQCEVSSQPVLLRSRHTDRRWRTTGLGMH